MKKAVVTGIVKDDGLLQLDVIKSEVSFKAVQGFLIEIGFKHEVYKILNRLGDQGNNYSAERYSNSLYQDLSIAMRAGRAYAIVVFGKNKMFITVHKHNINRIPVSILDKFFMF